MAFLKARRRTLLLRRLRRVGPAALPVPAAAARRARAGVGQEPVQLHAADLGGRAGRAAGGPRLQPGTGADHLRRRARRRLRPGQPGRAAGQRRRWTCSARWSVRASAPDGQEPAEAAELAKALLADLLEGMYEGTGSCIGLPELDRRATTSPSRGVGPAVQRHVPGAQGDAPDRRQRLHHRLLDHPARPHQPARDCCASRLLEEPSPNRPERFYGVVVGEVHRQQRAAGRPAEGADRPGQGQVPRPVGRPSSATGRRAPARWPGRTAASTPCRRRATRCSSRSRTATWPSRTSIGSLWNVRAAPPATNIDGTQQPAGDQEQGRARDHLRRHAGARRSR